MFNTSLSSTDLVFMLQGAWVTLKLTLWAMLIGTLVGLLMGWLRTLAPRATLPMAWVLDAFRSVPLLIQFVLFNSLKSILELPWSAFTVGCLVLGVYSASYCTEIVRSGLLAVGMSYFQTLRYVTLPMATRVAFPGWINLILSVMKDTSLVLRIGIIELLRASQTIVTRIQEPLLVLTVAGVIYYVMSLAIARMGNIVEKRWIEND
jgi:His/Glu/Gln/Arg/opine family amino acid ABC transporter permease subunit